MLSDSFIISLVLKNKFHLGMKHDAVSWFDQRKDYFKVSSTGSLRSRTGAYVRAAVVPRNEHGFIEACRIVINSWKICRLIDKIDNDGILLNKRGMKTNMMVSQGQNAINLGLLFNHYFKIFFINDIKARSNNEPKSSK